ncbi:MAG TPA: ATP-binding protein [Anaerolineae bacterium]|nr:ATP-binding protein [Anaerolineae bacterium]
MVTSTEPSSLTKLWSTLTHELAQILDGHGICATVANQVAICTGCTIIVGQTSLIKGYYDVWLANPNGSLEQLRWPQHKAYFTDLIEAGAPLLQKKQDRPPKEQINCERWHLAEDQILSIPIPHQTTPNSRTLPGILCILDPRPDCLLTPDTLKTLAAMITVHLDRAAMYQYNMRQEIFFDVVMDLSRALTSSLSLEKIYRQLLDPVRRVMSIQSISIGLTDTNTGEIVFISRLMGALFKDLPSIRLKKGQGIAGWVSEHAQPVVINNVYEDTRFYSKVDHLSGYKTHSMLCVPLKADQRVIGVMQAINKQVGEFTEDDLRLLQAISGPLGAAIENASLHADVLSEKQRIQAIFTSMSEGMMTVDSNGLITAVNDSLLALLQLENDQVIGENAYNIIRLREGDFTAYLAEVMIATNDNPQLASEIAKKNGSYAPVLISGAPIQNEDNSNPNEAILIFSDLTQIREVERMRDDFFHNIVHELRTPLATILMYARLLREGKAQGEKAERFLGVIERESDRLQTMVRQTLQLAKLEAHEIQRSAEILSLNHLFDEMLPPLADQALQKGLTFSQRIESDLPPVMGDHETLYMIFKNLVENAIKFTLTGTVRISAKPIPDKRQIEIIIKDEGIGIPEAALPNLFRRFYRARTAVEKGIAGTGLGLYMVREGVEKHQGSIDVTSEENVGTTFTIYLPHTQI